VSKRFLNFFRLGKLSQVIGNDKGNLQDFVDRVPRSATVVFEAVAAMAEKRASRRSFLGISFTILL